METDVYIFPHMVYDEDLIYSKLSSLPIFNMIRPGQKVVLKPNWVHEAHEIRKNDYAYVITHPSVITAVLRVVTKRLKCLGKISIIDGPMTGSDFDKLLAHYPVERWHEIVGDIQFEIVDLRDVVWRSINGIILNPRDLPGDPLGSVTVDLMDCGSEFGIIVPKNGFFGASNNIEETNYAHSNGRHLYKVSRTALECDVFINIPKLKSHKKAGITCSLKNLVGINTYKNYLPHHRMGTPKDGGDQYPENSISNQLESGLVNWSKSIMHRSKLFSYCMIPIKNAFSLLRRDKKTGRAGSWYGNDTIWRMILDLNKILLYSNSAGNMEKKRRMYISVVDGILGGEGEGPLTPDPIKSQILACGENPVSVDYVCALLMGFDPLKIPHLANAFQIDKYPIANFEAEDICIRVDQIICDVNSIPSDIITAFEPSIGWKGHIENVIVSLNG